VKQDIYAALGVKRRINAAGTLTRLGGALMDDEVIAAMAAAARSSVDIGELQAAANRAISRLNGAQSRASSFRGGLPGCRGSWGTGKFSPAFSTSYSCQVMPADCVKAFRQT
jgi:hypothetical protein